MAKTHEFSPEENGIHSLSCFADNEAWQTIWRDIEENIFTMFSHWEKVEYILKTLNISSKLLSDLLGLDRTAVEKWKFNSISKDSLHRMRAIGIPSQIVDSIRSSLQNEEKLASIKEDTGKRYPDLIIIEKSL